MLELQIIVLLILISLSAFFSGVETALMSIEMTRVKSLVKQKKKGSDTLYRIKQNPHRLLVTILIGNNIVNIGASAFAAVVSTEIFGSSGVGIAIGVMTLLILVFGEITPKTFSIHNTEKVSLLVARPIELTSYILYPLVILFESLSKAMSKILGSEKKGNLSEEELKIIVTMGEKEGIISKEAADMMRNVMEFKETEVREIMTPKIDIAMVNAGSKLSDTIDFIVKKSHSRYPAYLGDMNKIVGILDIDDVLKCIKNRKTGTKINNILRSVFFVPETKDIGDLLTEFDDKNVPMAVVVDEYGYVSGLVTVEDILEEIVGDIFDNSNRTSVYIKKVNDKLVRVDAKASVEEINRVLHLGLKGEHFNTIAGFIQHKLQRIPKKGEKVKLKNVTIEVDKVTKQGITSVNIIKS
jgi:putative hemolysin